MEYGQNFYTDANGQQILGCPFEFWGTAVVCFLDLLGFSQYTFREFSHKSDLAIQKFLAIRKHPFLASKGKESVKYGMYEIGDPLPEHLQDSFYMPVVHTASDSITISLGLPKNPIAADFALSHFSLHLHASWVIKLALDEGFAIRGAIELGDVFWNESDIIGPALINAYRIESKFANSVRIIYGPDYLRTILDLHEPARLSLFKSMWKDEDGLIMLKPDLHAGGSRDELRDKYQQLQDQVISEELKSKYASPLRYFHTNLDMPPDQNFDSDYISNLLTRYKYGK
jgi:hypothetical protein